LRLRLLQVHAIDDDLDRNGLIKYSVSDPDHFFIDEGGVLYNIKPLDFEHTNGEYLLQVTAEDQAPTRSERKKDVAPITIRVLNEPDAPEFDSMEYKFSVSEFASTGAYVGTVVARDEDGDFASYALEGVVPPDMFQVDATTGIIRVGRDTFGDVWTFDFLAVAVDLLGQSNQVPVKVEVIDENTNKPVFRECNDYDQKSIRENMAAGTSVLIVVAEDDDHGVNGEVTYSFRNDYDSFAIKTSLGQGYISTTQPLDRDDGEKEYYMTVIARDGAQTDWLLGACSFRIIVEDENDNPPIFDQASYMYKLPTDRQVGTEILRVTATDKDAGLNADVVYGLEGDATDLEFFQVDPDTGIISLRKKLTDDMADHKTFSLTARAEDKGAPPMSSTAPVTLDVVASGKQPPSIVTQSPASPRIDEDAQENSEVVYVCATSNIPRSPNVYFTLLNGNTRDTNDDGSFDVRPMEDGDTRCPPDTKGASIYVALRNLDYEAIRSYKLILQLVNDENSRTDEQILVQINDVNDNPPLLQPFDGAVVENAEPVLITTIQAVDKDASEQYRNLVFTFDEEAVTQDVRDKFRLRTNGELSTLMKLDRENASQYRVPVMVTDGEPSHVRRRTYWITVQDVNDEPPRFNASSVLEVELPERTDVGKDTGIKLVVLDPDVVNHNEFQIVEGNDYQKFRIDATTGDVLVNQPLDYDFPTNDRNFTMKVRLSDGANQPAETVITIAVTNDNDQQPVFQPSNYNFTVTENVNCSIQIGKVTALDPDLPSTADQNIQYFLSTEDERNFTIAEKTGDLTLKGCLDREAANRGTMTLYPYAMDEGGNGLDAIPATVIININDVNDNHPYIQSPDNSYAVLMENQEPNSPGHRVVIQLDDWDSDENGCPCTLAFDQNTPADIMQKFDVTGGTNSQYELRPKVVLDREQQKVYRIPFRTKDRWGVAGTRVLSLEVGDENDSPMTDGESAINVYNYQGQFPDIVIGSVYVTDLDDYDVTDKIFELDPSSPSDGTYFEVNLNTGNITMKKGTPEGTHTLRVKVTDTFRDETAIGTVNIHVVDLTEEAVMQSGSFRVANHTAHDIVKQSESGGASLYARLRERIGRVHGIPAENVDVFGLKDVAEGVDVRYNCHSSPYYTAARLDGLMLASREEIMADLGISIPLVDINSCLYESLSPCQEKSCQHTLRPNLTSPLVVASDVTTMVGVDIADDYTCDCGALEPPHTVCHDGFCLNGGTCVEANQTLVCECPDSANYGPRCELTNARFEMGFAWYEAPKVCDNSSFSMSFETRDPDGLLLYAGPMLTRPWQDYPKDFVYVVLRNWVLEAYLDLGSGTVGMKVNLEQNSKRSFDFFLSWTDDGISLEVPNCLGNSSSSATACKKTTPLPGTISPSVLLNTPGPLQLGGVVDTMPSFEELASSYEWTIVPPVVQPIFGCVLEVRYNDYLYDLNSTDYTRSTYLPCNAPTPAKVILGQQSIIIIVVSLSCLILLVLLILCLARRGKKTISHPELDGIVKETIGGTDLEGYGEKDMTQYDLKLLRVGPDGHLFNDEDRRRPPDVVDDRRQERMAPLAQMPDGLSIGDFINDNIKKVDKEPTDFDDVRHYCFEGDEMSIASLSSIDSSGSTDSGSQAFDYANDWGPRFEKLNQIYRRDSDEEEDSEFDFNIPKGRKRDTLPGGKPKGPPAAQSPADGAPGLSSGDAQRPGRPRDGPSVTFATPETQGSREGLLPESPQRRDYHEAVNPMADLDEMEGAESWC
ncbi:neural-cadherin-like, partial [Penaeus indicus]|uniref:neural-cadherin-like n=1 Tax=Penaeus indicus TaxID=29960 RepID=UPI00300C7EA8